MKTHKLTEGQLTRYRDYLRQEERSPATIEKYMHDTEEFFQWLLAAPVTKEVVIAWKDELRSRGLAPATVNAKLCAVNGLLRFLGWDECRVKLLRIQKRSFREQERALSKTEYLRLLDAARNRGEPRLKLLMEAICSTGIRVSEVRYLTVEAVRAGRAVVSLKGKVREILLPGKLCRELQKYARKQKIVSGEIFLTKDGGRLSRKQIWREMKSLCVKAGVEASKVYPHNLRHLFATAFYKVCRDISKLADVLGHSSINTTRIYLQTTGAEHVRHLNQMSLIL